jgi:SNF2 family DNA or RNA helicase
MDMGTGKSKVAVNEIGTLWDEGKIDRVLIVAGKGSFLDWRDKHIPESLDPEIDAPVYAWTSSGSRGEREFTAFLREDATLKFFLTTYDALGSSAKAQRAADIFVTPRTAIYCDESSKMKNKDAIRTKQLMKLGRRACVRRIMTGTDITQGPMDLWSQFQFLGRGLLGFTSYMSFRARYCTLERVYLSGRSIEKISGYKNLDELKTVVDQYSYRITKEECTDLPPKIYRQQRVELTDEQRRMYNEMREECLVDLDNGEFASATRVLDQLRMLHRITCGHIRGEDGVVRLVENRRVQAVLEIAEECTGGVAVWCAYHADVEATVAALRAAYGPKSVVAYYGKTPQDERTSAIARVQSGEVRFFVGTAATGGYGITLTALTNVIYFSNSFSLEQRLQSEDRVYRIGQEKVCTYTDLVAPGTLDQHILDALSAKREVADLVATGEIRKWLARVI